MTILDSPECISRRRTMTVAFGDEVQVSCHVKALPSVVGGFTWRLNSSVGGLRLLPSSSYTQTRDTSLLIYRPLNKQDYGTLTCEAQNEIGKQKIPCTYHLKPAGK